MVNALCWSCCRPRQRSSRRLPRPSRKGPRFIVGSTKTSVPESAYTVTQPFALNGRDASIVATQDFQIMYTGVDTVLRQEYDNPRADAVLSLRFVSLSRSGENW